jgi:hypothetical protein
MHNSDSLAAVRSAAVSTLTNQFIRRFAISALLTGFDGSVLIASGRAVFDAFNETPWLTVAFVFAAVGLLLTLGRIWFLTFRQARLAVLNPNRKRGHSHAQKSWQDDRSSTIRLAQSCQ